MLITTSDMEIKPLLESLDNSTLNTVEDLKEALIEKGLKDFIIQENKKTGEYEVLKYLKG